MSTSELAINIPLVLNGQNYVLWAQAMSGYLHGHKLWRIITGDITEPTKGSEELDTKFVDRLEEWDSKNQKIISAFRSTSIPSIGMQFGRFETAKAAWDFLADRYTTAGLSHQYQLLDQLHRMRQEPGKAIDSFHSRMQALWDQLAASEPTWSCSQDTTKFLSYRNQQRLIHFLMALDDIFEPSHAILLHRTPLPTLESAVSELVSYETRRCTRLPPSTESALAAPSAPTHTALTTPPSGRPSLSGCKFCHEPDHTLLYCPTRVCKHCHKRGPGHFLNDCPRNPNPQPRHDRSRSNSFRSNRFKPHHRSTAAAATEDSSSPTSPTSSLSHADLTALLKQVLSTSGNPPPTALSVTPGTSSWYFDSACCNHMTSDNSLFTTKALTSHLPAIHTANGSHMHVHHIGQIFNSKVSLPDTYFIPQFTLNLISVGQLCELGLNVTFSSTGCLVQDPKTGQKYGTQ